MSNDFWFSIAIAAVVGGFWLYKKGKGAVSTIRKIQRSFKGVCLNPKSRLSDEQCKKLAVGAMYASQQGAYQNSIETGIADLLPKILGEWWGIESTDSARKELDYLCEKGYRYYFPFVYKAFLLDKPEAQDEVFQQNMSSQEDFLARGCCEMGYITEADAWNYIDSAYNMALSTFSSWKDMAMSYVIGRSLWGGKNAYNSVMKDTADELLTHENSPWKKYAW